MTIDVYRERNTTTTTTHTLQIHERQEENKSTGTFTYLKKTKWHTDDKIPTKKKNYETRIVKAALLTCFCDTLNPPNAANEQN